MDEVKDKERRIYFGDMLMAIGAVLVTIFLVYGISKVWNDFIAGLIAYLSIEGNIMFLMCFIGLVLILIGVVVNMMGPPFGRLG